LKSGDLLHAHAVTLAAAGSAKRLDAPGKVENFGKGVSYCATCDGFFFRDKTVVTEIQSNESGVRAVSLKNTGTSDQRELATDGVFIFVGFSPSNQLVPAGIKVNPSGYVIADEKCETSIPGIFAVGDLRQEYARQIVIAAADGCTAALAVAHQIEMKKASAVCFTTVADVPAGSA
jgi:thioredoxin reductase